MLLNIFIALIGLSFLILIHELGHYAVARFFNIGIARFSIGFGPKLFSWKDRYGTEFVLSALLLGGYVRFSDLSELSAHQQHRCFFNKPVRTRMAVVSAGPLANLILTYILFVILNLYGIEGIKPIIDKVRTPSPAATAGLQSGDEILHIDDVRVYTWQEAGIQFVGQLGKERVPVVIEGANGITRDISMNLQDTSLGGLETAGIFDLLGFTPLLPSVSATIGMVQKDSPAATAGLQENDKILRINNKPIEKWSELAAAISSSSNKPLALTILRNEQEIPLTLTPLGIDNEEGGTKGFAGIAPAAVTISKEYMNVHSYSFFNVWQPALQKTLQSLKLVLQSFSALLMGELSVRSLSGPVSIVKYVGDSVHSGIQDFLFMLSFISISLFFFNLLPIPVLDGGHIVLYIIEAMRGEPLSDAFQKYYLRIGTVLLLSLFVFVTFNDILQLL